MKGFVAPLLRANNAAAAKTTRILNRATRDSRHTFVESFRFSKLIARYLEGFEELFLGFKQRSARQQQPSVICAIKDRCQPLPSLYFCSCRPDIPLSSLPPLHQNNTHSSSMKRFLVCMVASLLTSEVFSKASSPSLFGMRKATSSSYYGSDSSALTILRGGSSTADDNVYAAQLEQTKADVIESANKAIEELRQQILDQGAVVEDFGQAADKICNEALQLFAQGAPEAGNDVSKAVIYDRKLTEIEAALDAPLQVLYLRQLAYLREAALQRFRTSTKTTGVSEYEAMLQADSQFVVEAEKATRQGSADWDFTTERSFLQAIMNNFAETSRKAQDAAVTASQQQQIAMQILQNQQQTINQLQMQLYGQTSPWNVGVAYRIPDTNFNLQGSYQQGRANVQLSCVPDEYAQFLGPNGFTSGVGPGNLGLSLNLSV